MRQTGRVWARRLALVGVAGVIGGAALAQPPGTPAPQPAHQPAPGTPPAVGPNDPVAYVHGGITITRQDLGEFLIARYGKERLDLLINRVIIEKECREKGITVTETEMLAAFNADLDGLSVDKTKFVTEMLPEYKKTLYEWMEDVIRPKLLMMKLMHEKTKVTEAEVAAEYDKEFGEKRKLQVIAWPKNENPKSIESTWVKVRDNAEEFDRAATNQANARMGASCGRSAPLTRGTHGKSDMVTKRAFELKVGEVSEVLTPGTPDVGFVVIKLLEIVPPAKNVDVAKVRPVLERRAYEEKVTREMTPTFQALLEAAKPNRLYDGPSKWRDAADVVRNTAPAPVMPSAMPGSVPAPGGPVKQTGGVKQ